MKHNVAVIGCGLWGRNIVRNFFNLNALHTVCDLDEENLKKVIAEYPNVNTTKNIDDVANNSDIDAVVVATPSHTHFANVSKMLNAGKHVYVEKPIATTAEDAKKLVKLAEEKNLTLMVGHLLLYHPAVNRLKMLVDEGALGKISYVQSDRLNINYFKNDRSVMWDLAPHDISMTAYILGKKPLKVTGAVGASSDFNDIMDITHVTILFEDGIVAQISDSWIHPVKRVCLIVKGSKATAVFDDTLAEDKLKIFDHTSPGTVKYEALDYPEIEPLKLECNHFLNCIDHGIVPRSDGLNGYQTVSIIEEAEKIMLGERRSDLDNVDFALSRSKKKEVLHG